MLRVQVTGRVVTYPRVTRVCISSLCFWLFLHSNILFFKRHGSVRINSSLTNPSVFIQLLFCYFFRNLERSTLINGYLCAYHLFASPMSLNTLVTLHPIAYSSINESSPISFLVRFVFYGRPAFPFALYPRVISLPLTYSFLFPSVSRTSSTVRVAAPNSFISTNQRRARPEANEPKPTGNERD